MLCTHKTASSASLAVEICPQFNNSFLHQFLSNFGGNCIKYDGALVQVIEVYSADSDSPTKRQKFHRNHGLAMAVIISSAEPCSPVAKKQKTNSPTSKLPNGKGVANKTVGTKEVIEIPD